MIREHHFGSVNSPGRISLSATASRISQPHDMRRLRKTVKSARAALLGTLAGAAGDDHHCRGLPATTTRKPRPFTRSPPRRCCVRSRRSCNAPHRDQHSWPRRQPRSPNHRTDPELAEIAATVAAETPTEQELTIACRDPYDAPFMDQGALCHASPSMCLQCRNAIVFRDHLPRLIAYREALDAIENNTPPRVFSEIYGQQRVNIDAIVAEFPPEQIEAARRADIQHLHRPLGQGLNNDQRTRAADLFDTDRLRSRRAGVTR